MIVAWFPDEVNKTGIFIQEQIKSLGDSCLISVITVNVCKTTRLCPTTKISIYEEANYTRYDVAIETAIRRLGVNSYLIKRAYKKVIEFLEKKHKIDLLHIHVRNDVTKLITSINLDRYIPFVVTEHWSFYQSGIMQYPAKERTKIIQETKTWYSHTAIKAVLPVSNMLGNIMHTRYDVKSEIITKVGNVSSNCFEYTQNQRKKTLTIDIVLAASWYYPKNPMLFLASLKKILPESRYKINVHWIGSGPQLELIQETITNGFDGANFTFYGMLSKPEIAKIFNQANFLVHPSDSENLPTIIAEALCSGLPVLSNSVGGIPEMIDESNGVLVEANNINLFSKALLFMIENHSRFDQQNISITAKALYSADAIGKQLLIIYNKCINEK